MQKLAKSILRVYFDSFVKELLKNLKNTTQLLRNTKDLLLWYYRKRFGCVDRRIIESYCAKKEIRKLQIGCGRNILKDWLNTDFFTYTNKVVHLDATVKFPFANDTFDYIFSEHMIEHISYSNGLVMLGECHRVLKKFGKIRISTPNLEFLIDLYGDMKSELQYEYIRWTTDHFFINSPYYDDTFVINNFFRDWGHLFIYNEKTLRWSLENAGFSKIVRCNINESEDEAFRNLENEERYPEQFLKLESLILEGTKILDS